MERESMAAQPSPPMDGPQRHVRLPGTSNLRDLGGYRAGEGRRVRWGRLFRSGAMPKLGEADWRWMRDRDVATVCDLRSADERALAPTRWSGPERTRHIHADYDARLIFGQSFVPPRPGAAVNDLHQSLYALFADILAPALGEMFEALLDEQVPLIFHCSAGQDRTGLAAGLLLALLGVDRATIYADYLLSTECRQFDNELDRTGIAAFERTNIVARFYTRAIREQGIEAVKPRRLVDAEGQALLKQALDGIESRFGGLEDYAARRLGLRASGVARLRELYLEPAC
jgi:protein-tyrosine phosphatase